MTHNSLLRTPGIFIFLLFTSAVTFGQLTPDDVKGCYTKRYELNLDTLINTIDINFCIDGKSGFALTLAVDEKPFHYYGTYAIQNDTMVFHVDPVFYEFQLGSRINTRIKKKQTKVTIPFTDNSLSGITLTVLNADSTVTNYYASQFEYKEKEAAYTSLLELPTDATIQVTDIYGKQNIFEYRIPQGANDLLLAINTEQSFTKQLYALKVDAGIRVAEQKSKLQKSDTLRYGSFDVNMFNNISKSNIPKEYTLITPFHIQEHIIDEYTDNYIDTSTYDYPYDDLYDDYGFDTLNYSSNYTIAKKIAEDSSKYLILYYEPVPCNTCGTYTLSKAIQILNNPNTYPQIATQHAEKSVFYFAPPQDSTRFKQFGITTFPATVILDPEGKLLYTEQGKDLHFLKTAYNSYTYGDFYAKLNIHKTFTYLPEDIKKSGYDSSYVFDYLNNLWSSGLFQEELDDTYVWYEEGNDTYMATDTTFEYVKEEDPTNYNTETVEYIVPTEDIFRSALKLSADSLFTYSLFDTLVSKYHPILLTDSITLNKFIRYFHQLDNQYCAYTIDNNHEFISHKAFKFLIDHYDSLKNNSYYISEYDGPVSLYEIISKRINGAINNAPNEYKLKSLQYQWEVIKKLPAIEHFEMPLHISHLIFLYDSLHHSQLEESYTIDYLNAIGGNSGQTSAVCDSIQQHLQKTNNQETLYFDYAYNYYYTFGGNYRYYNDELPETIYHKFKYAEILNSVAWHYYKSITDPSKLKLAINWSKSSLTLEPHNPYFLDTYAHLLYKTGNRKEALKYQKKAIAEMNSKTIQYEIDYTQRENIEGDLLKMKKKTL